MILLGVLDLAIQVVQLIFDNVVVLLVIEEDFIADLLLSSIGGGLMSDLRNVTVITV